MIKKSGLAGSVYLKKAFDTIDHSILLTKLDLYEFRGTTNTFLQSYLGNRKQYVSFVEKTLIKRMLRSEFPKNLS